MKTTKRLSIAAVLLAALLPFGLSAKSAKQKLSGTVINPASTAIGIITDAQTGEPIVGVPVTDGYSYTATDRNGVYQMTLADSARMVYYSLPRDYAVNLDEKTRRPAFYSSRPLSRDSVNRIDFQLTRLDAPEEEITLLMIGDPQCRYDADLMRYLNETLPDVSKTVTEGQYPNVYAFTLGDLTWDNVVMWPRVSKAMRSIEADGREIPVFNCVGNHDHDAAKDNDYDALHNYVRLLGPTDYSINRGQTHIVVMDDIYCTHKRKPTTWTYKGGFTPRQVEWLRQDLATVENPEETDVVLCVHIPFRDDTELFQREVMEMLSSFRNAHIMTGHTHYQQPWIHSDFTSASGAAVYEHIHGAACGAWWTCNSNTDGQPNGYNIYSFNDSGLQNWIAKSVGKPLDEQMRVWNGSQLFGDRYPMSWAAGGDGGSEKTKVRGDNRLDSCFVVELWNDDGPMSKADTLTRSTWEVDLVLADGRVLPMERLNHRIAMIPAAAYFFNEVERKGGNFFKPTRYVWYVKAPSGDPAEEQGWTVRARQTIPTSGAVNEYTCSVLTTDYDCF